MQLDKFLAEWEVEYVLTGLTNIKTIVLHRFGVKGEVK
jgi:hypothetical protein